MLRIFAFLLALFVCSSRGQTAQQVAYNERTLQLLTNALRASPVQFERYLFPSNSVSTSCAQGIQGSVGSGLFLDPGLTKAALFHCTSMSSTSGDGNTCFQHDTCPGNCRVFGTCNWAQRVWTFYQKPGAIVGENLGIRYGGAASVLKAWLASPAHCRNLIGADFREIGIAQVGEHWCQDFGDFSGAGGEQVRYGPVSGSHLTPGKDVPDPSNLYIALVYQSNPSNPIMTSPRIVSVHLNEIGIIILPLLYGTNGILKVYATKLSSAIVQRMASTSSCSSGGYFFQVFDNSGVIFRFPETGSFYPFGIGGCVG